MARFTKATYLTKCVMDQAFKSGLTMLATKVSGDKTKQMVAVSFGMPMATFTKVNGKMTKQMVMVSTCM